MTAPLLPSILVLMMHSGEPQFRRAAEAVRAQSGVKAELQIFSGLSNVEAHRRLYTAVMQRSSEFDLFVKLDADMILRDDRKLQQMWSVAVSDRDVDHLIFTVSDFFTDQQMVGVHCFSPRVRWADGDEALFVDPSPRVPGKRRIHRAEPSPVADHCPDPSLDQAFQFGIHRALKAFQPGTSKLRASQAHEQWKILTQVWTAFERTRDPRRGAVIAGADLLWRKELSPGPAGYRAFSWYEHGFARTGDPERIFGELAARWRPGIFRVARRIRTLGPSGAVRSFVAALVLKVRRPPPLARAGRVRSRE